MLLKEREFSIYRGKNNLVLGNTVFTGKRISAEKSVGVYNKL